MNYRVREIDGKHYPEKRDPDLGWVGNMDGNGLVSYDTNALAWQHMKENPDNLNVDVD